MKRKGNVFVASLIVAGTGIGSSFVSAPIMTGIAGFIPGTCMTILIWLFSMALALITAEATLANPDGANVITITRNLIGKTWMVIFGTAFLFINLLPIVGYYILSVPQILWLSEYFFSITISPYLSILVLAIIFGFVLALGVPITGRINSVLMLIFLGVLGFVLIRGSEFVKTTHLFHENWLYAVFALPILFNAIAYVAVIPSLCTYVNRDVKKIKWMIVIGSFIILFTYLFWQYMVIGTTSSGALWFDYEAGNEVYHPLSWSHESPVITGAYRMIIFLAVITCLIGLYIAMIDMVNDGLKIAPENRKGGKRFLITAILFIPPVVVYYLFPQIFTGIVIQKFLSPILVILTTAVMPIWWVINSRYFHKTSSPRLLPGGSWVMAVLVIALVVISYLEGVELAS